MSTGIPNEDDFRLVPDWSQDREGWWAWEDFGGRTLDEAYAIFRENPLRYQEDLMWMAPKPFCFYLPIALRYLQSEDSSGDSNIVNCLASDIEFHFSCSHDISAAFPCIRAICDYVLSHYSKFGVYTAICGDLRPQYQGLRRKVGEPGAAPLNGGPSTPLGDPKASEGPPSVS
jgi:hypothetical protein